MDRRFRLLAEQHVAVRTPPDRYVDVVGCFGGTRDQNAVVLICDDGQKGVEDAVRRDAGHVSLPRVMMCDEATGVASANSRAAQQQHRDTNY